MLSFQPENPVPHANHRRMHLSLRHCHTNHAILACGREVVCWVTRKCASVHQRQLEALVAVCLLYALNMLYTRTPSPYTIIPDLYGLSYRNGATWFKPVLLAWAAVVCGCVSWGLALCRSRTSGVLRFAGRKGGLRGVTLL